MSRFHSKEFFDFRVRVIGDILTGLIVSFNYKFGSVFADD